MRKIELAEANSGVMVMGKTSGINVLKNCRENAVADKTNFRI